MGTLKKGYQSKMFTDWQNIFTTDCTVIKFSDNEYVYPIFKNGFSSLEKYATEHKLELLKNEQLSELKEISVFLRDPVERFVSGVHTMIELEQIKNVDKFLQDVETLRTYDRHFIPQVYWLFHLLKYYKGKIKIQSVSELYDLIPNRNGPKIAKMSADRKQRILQLNFDKYIVADERLLYRYLNKTVDIKSIIEEFKYALSTA